MATINIFLYIRKILVASYRVKMFVFMYFLCHGTVYLLKSPNLWDFKDLFLTNEGV